jgi:hypothetical protein
MPHPAGFFWGSSSVISITHNTQKKGNTPLGSLQPNLKQTAVKTPQDKTAELQ